MLNGLDVLKTKHYQMVWNMYGLAVVGWKVTDSVIQLGIWTTDKRPDGRLENVWHV
jgi:hypothetical protein